MTIFVVDIFCNELFSICSYFFALCVPLYSFMACVLMIRWLGRLGRCLGASDHAIFCFPCGVCFGCVWGHLIVTLQLHLHSHDYIAVVACCNDSFSSPICLSCVHRSCGEPRPTSFDACILNCDERFCFWLLGWYTPCYFLFPVLQFPVF